MSTKISFDLPDFSLVVKNATASTLQEAGQAVERIAKETAPADTSNYKNHIEYDQKNSVIAHASYSAAIEYGTKPHIIEPTGGKKALAFQKDGQEIIVKKVNHPGTKPNPVMRNAALKVKKQVGGMFYDNFRKDLKKYRVK